MPLDMMLGFSSLQRFSADGAMLHLWIALSHFAIFCYLAWKCTVSQNLTRRSALGILRRDARMDVMFRSEEKNYTGFIMIDSIRLGTAFEKRKAALLSKQDCMNDQNKCCSRQFSQLRIAGSLRHFYAISAWGCVGKHELIWISFI